MALAWTADAPFAATVHGHVFKHVSVRDEGDGVCGRATGSHRSDG
jgi:hypothetical protein